MSRYGIKFYTKGGAFKHFEYKDNFYELLQLYIQHKDESPSPTIWILNNDRTDYVRVHDFQFSRLTPETYNKYLDERIIETDDLLSTVQKVVGTLTD